MKVKQIHTLLIILALVSVFIIFGCSSGGDSGDDDSVADDASDDADDAVDDAKDDDTQVSDDATDDAADDSEDDAADDATDDSGDDDTLPAAPTWPDNHDASWDCYTCHTDDFLGSPQEPHDHFFVAPTGCVLCHSSGDWTNTPSGPSAPATHNPSMDCLTCHGLQHGKTWQDKNECRVCHDVGSGTTPPTYPDNHNQTWDCYICHAAPFHGSPQEPHNHGYTSPDQCITCHQQGAWTNTPSGPEASDGHNSGMDCLTCHSGKHDTTWQDAAQCKVCHNAGAGSPPPTYPDNHGSGWNCYICHAADFNGAQGEPHGAIYTAPSECDACHLEGSWTNPPSGPEASDGHSRTDNCMTCHGQKHGKTWETQAQCLVCHDVGTDGSPAQSPANHIDTWDCYICHAADFNGARGEPHGHAYTSPDQCVICHTHGSGTYTLPGDGAPDGHNDNMNCFLCHNQVHSKTWQDTEQCETCHSVGEDVSPPTFSINHNPAWNCYLCHQVNFQQAPAEPHSHAYTAPADCLLCHEQGSNFYNPPYEGHNGTQNCLSCHSTMHSRSWQTKAQCLYCHKTL